MDRLKIVLLVTSLSLTTSSFGVFVDGKGHYALRGESRQKPGYTGNSAFQAIDQFFRLETEIRSGDKASFITEFSLFSDKRSAYLGDSSAPENCSPIVSEGDDEGLPENTGNSTECDGRQQNILEPGYQAYIPMVTKAYARFATDVCLLTAGRRDRHWGMGILHDNGKAPFSTSASIYDGITCDVNVQRSQSLGFSVGYDKISETGSNTLGEEVTYGPTNQSDDLDQLFFTINYSDGQNASSNLSKEISIYFANIMGKDQLSTDVKIADLYLSFYLPQFIIKQEILFRLGKSADPNISRIGGITGDAGSKVKNKIDSIAAAGSLEWILSRTGSTLGPANYNKGTLSSHSLFMEYAYAPGDSDGYLPQRDSTTQETGRDTQATAIAFHSNYKPALIMFNERRNLDHKRVDGIYDPNRVMNTTIFGLGYRFSSLEDGEFEAKLITASLNESISSEGKAYWADKELPVGYNGKSLGFELDLSYRMNYDHGLEIGGAIAAAIPGEALDTNPNKKPDNQLLLQSFVSFTF